ncbi:MAG: hypothetical protein FJ134_01395 [Deltaproteobacteria bacterium]|nr:hypothetical protein [Deltaproteobacteria bacterium]
MNWQVYEIVLRLRSPMHIGCGKVGNLLRTRGYVLGRVLWGALTMRLTRLQPGPAADSRLYRAMGDRIHQSLAYTYLYPALKQGTTFRPIWPWEEDFNSRFLGSYASTALSYPQQTAEEGALHEVEFISPFTNDTGQPVHLLGYLVTREDAPDWRAVLGQIQLGAERCYGWGWVEPANDPLPLQDEAPLFGGDARIELANHDRPFICLEDGKPLLAHAHLSGLPAAGAVEPLVGREWRSDNLAHCYAGQHVEFAGIYFQPGSKILQSQRFQIGHFGLWTPVP